MTPAPADVEVVAPDVLFGAALSAGAAGAPVGAGGAAGVVGAWFPTDHWGVHLGVHEGLWSTDLRFVGQIEVGARWRVHPHIDLLGGFVHHHETPWDAALDDPLGAAMGVAAAIRHRSGATLGASAGWPLARAGETTVVGRIDLTGAVLAGDGPLATGQARGVLTVEIPTLRR
jgi:hypothetical protein